VVAAAIAAVDWYVDEDLGDAVDLSR